MAGNLYVGAAAPVRTVFDVTSTGGAFDLSTIDSASLLVRFSDGSAATWLAAVEATPPDVAPTTTRARLIREHLADDIPAGVEGTARVCASLTLVGGAVIRTRWRPVEILREGV